MSSLEPKWINVGYGRCVWRSQTRQVVMKPHSMLTEIKPDDLKTIQYLSEVAMHY